MASDVVYQSRRPLSGETLGEYVDRQAANLWADVRRVRSIRLYSSVTLVVNGVELREWPENEVR